MLSKILVIASIVWPVLLGASVWANVRGDGPRWTAIVYLVGSRICHQRPERSFHTDGVQWPVCGRCSGLYLAAPFGAVVAAGAVRRRARAKDARLLVGLAAVPTIATIAIEWLGLAPISSLARALAALPLGAAIAFVLVRTTLPESPESGRVN